MNELKELNLALKELLDKVKELNRGQNEIIEAMISLIKNTINECQCQKCGSKVKCLHDEAERHIQSICQNCAN